MAIDKVILQKQNITIDEGTKHLTLKRSDTFY